MKIRIPILWILSAAMACPPTARALDPEKSIAQYILDIWRIEDGLPQSSIYAIEQTPDGYLWIGTQEGLVRFDGIRFVVFNTVTTPSIPENWVNCLSVSKDGGLWIGTFGGGLSKYKNGTTHSFGPADGLQAKLLHSLVEDRKGVLWIASQDAGLIRFDGKVFEPAGNDRSLPSEAIRHVYESPSGVLYAGTTGKVLKFYQDTSTSYLLPPAAGKTPVTTLLEDKNGTLWLGTFGAGLFKLVGGNVEKAFQNPRLNYVRCMIIDRNDNLWVGTNDGGLHRMQRNGTASFDRTGGLTDDRVFSLFEDREGSLWLGASGGLHRLRDARFSVIGAPEGLSSDAVFPILQTRNGDLWLGTELGLNRLRDNRITTYRPGDGLSHPVVIALCETRQGELWIGTEGGGINVLVNGIWRSYTILDGLNSNLVQMIYQDRRGIIYVAGEEGGLTVFDGTRFRTYDDSASINKAAVFAMMETRDSALWFGTSEGLLKRQNGITTWIVPAEGRAEYNIRSLLEDEDGTLWIGTRGSGLLRLQGEQWTNYTVQNGLYDDLVYHVLDDGHGYLWITCNRGLYRVRKGQLDAFADGSIERITYDLFGRADGMRGTECNGGFHPAGWKDLQGRLWIPTINGAVLVEPAKMETDDVEIPIVIEEAVADGHTIASDYGIRFQSGVRSIEIHYTGLVYTAPERLRFRYRLDGFEDEWQYAGNRRTAFYTNLPPGDFTFQVSASIDGGTWPPRAIGVSVTVTPHFYQTKWFLAGSIASILALIVAFSQWRLHSVRKRKNELELLVGERTARLEEANRNKNHILGIVAHDLRNPLASITGYADMIVQNPETETGTRSDAGKILNASERMNEIIEQLLVIAAIDAGQVQMVLQETDFGDVVAQVLAQLTPIATGKGQSIRVSMEPGVRVLADKDKLKSVVENLISNAIKYSPPDRLIRVVLSNSGSVGKLIVEDEGLGISPEDVPRLFQRWIRLSNKPTRGESSTGLGLSIVKQYLELQNGRIRYERPGNGIGSVFVVEMPRA